MKHYNKFGCMMRGVTAAAAFAAVLFAPGCTEVDDTLGANFIPDNQEMKIGTRTLGEALSDAQALYETRLYRTDSIVSSNLTVGYFGTMVNDTFGLRTTGFMTEFLSYYTIDEEFFGYRPIFDSAQLLVTISDYTGDTLTPLRFNVYEVVTSCLDAPEQSDSTFYLNFDVMPYVDPEPLFTFTFPDGQTTGPSTTAITMQPTEKGRDFVKRLMLDKEGWEYKEDYTLYDDDTLWLETFKGLYIVPAEDAAAKGGLYAADLTGSGLAIYGRNRVESDPTLIQDTLSLVYYFYDSSGHLTQSINTVRRDYTKATASIRIDPSQIEESNEERATNSMVFVEGMGGVATEVTFTQAFFDELKRLLTDEEAQTGTHYTSLGINQAVLRIYFEDGSYEWDQITNIDRLAEQMDASLPRLGLYVSYKNLTGIPDYYYTYENAYSTELPYGGYINRSQGCYVLNISGYIQALWTKYLAEEQAAEEEGRAVDLQNVAYRTVYLAPEAYSLYAMPYAVLQGMADGINTAPMKIDLTYTLIK